jgi:alpha-beta hydrolase superfamily lysophospholipase
MDSTSREIGTGHFAFRTNDGHDIFTRYWKARVAKYVILVVHGFKDHSNRYSCLGEWFAFHEGNVFGIDLRAQGETAGLAGGAKELPRHNGWKSLLSDLYQLIEIVRKETPGVNLYLYGHSMGSMLVRDFIIHHPLDIDGAILSGTTFQPSHLMKVGKWLTTIVTRTRTPEHQSRFVERLIFNPYQRSVKDAGQKRDWLTHDADRVGWISQDPLSQNCLSVEFYRQFFRAVPRIQKLEQRDRENLHIYNNLPIFIISGDEDPVGGMGNHPKKLHENLLANGHQNAALKIYTGKRHELHNEVDRDAVFKDILAWIKRNS